MCDRNELFSASDQRGILRIGIHSEAYFRYLFIGGWFTPAALNEMPEFDETFNCNPDADYHGFKSFDDFFTRTLVEGPDGKRPIASPENDMVIANACENAPYQIAYSIQKHDAFWVKSQPYSMQYILKGAEEYIDRFVGGTIYQGFLSPHTYHRFHAPVSGEVVHAKVKMTFSVFLL